MLLSKDERRAVGIVYMRQAVGKFLRSLLAYSSECRLWYRMYVASFPRCVGPLLRNWLGRRWYRLLSEQEILESRASDTVFVFGSGYSINDISDEEWTEISRFDTISFRDFPRQSFIRAGYHLTAEVDDLQEYAARLRENPLYDSTLFVVQGGFSAINGNELIGRRMLPEGRAIYRFRRKARGRYEPPSQSLANGLVHGFSSVMSVVNFAYLMRWKQIVLVGIDLYDKRYFWLGPDEGRAYEKSGLKYDSRFETANEIVDALGKWREIFEEVGVELFVYNPRSLLTQALPVYSLPVAAKRQQE